MLNPQRIIADIDAIFVMFPDLEEDTKLKYYVLDHGTDFKLLLEMCLDDMRETETLAEAIDLRIATLKDRRNRLDHKAETRRKLMQKIMEHAQIDKFAMAEATLSLVQRPVHVIITDEAVIPWEFTRIKSEPDKQKISAALKDGKEIPGTILSNGGIGLNVRTK